MSSRVERAQKDQLKKLQLKRYRIYGIFNFETEEMIYVTLSLDDAAFQFDLEGYDEAKFGVISFDVMVH